MMDSRPWWSACAVFLAVHCSAALKISRVVPTLKHVIVEAGLARSPVHCPTCGLPSGRLHSHYPRVLRDLPWQGRPATIRVTARRFRCLNPACARKTFAERLGSVASVSARRTARLGDLQRHVAFALGSEAAARLAKRLAIPISPDTLLRMAAKPVVAEAPPPILSGAAKMTMVVAVGRYEDAARLQAAGVSILAIAAAVGAERKTIRRWLQAGGAPLWSKPPRTGILTPYHTHLEDRWTEGCRNASLLWREVAELGFTGRPGVVLLPGRSGRVSLPGQCGAVAALLRQGP